MARASEGAEEVAFARTLSALKERGSNLLVVGTTYDRGHPGVCERLLGEGDVRRRRLLVRVDGDCGSVPCDETAESRVLTQHVRGRERPDPEDVPVECRVVQGGIDSVEQAVVEHLADLVDGADDIEPAELRLCVDSLRPLLVHNSPERVQRFVEHLGQEVSGRDGMGHFHLPAGSDDRYVSLLTPVVDAVVEVRVEAGQPQQRWHVFEGAVDSGWLPL